ncbi:hypothetical protein GN956_G6159 [Arapaima gigas]
MSRSTKHREAPDSEGQGLVLPRASQASCPPVRGCRAPSALLQRPLDSRAEEVGARRKCGQLDTSNFVSFSNADLEIGSEAVWVRWPKANLPIVESR